MSDEANELRALCEKIQAEARSVLVEGAGLAAREDSRAFGASVERRILDAWPCLCAAQTWACEAQPGRRTLYDVSCRIGGVRYGVDVKTTDVDEGRYADGGVCSVDNLLRFLAGRRAEETGTLLLLEVTHGQHDTDRDRRSVRDVIAAPIHCLPRGEVRIENLGTGQVRLNRRLVEVASQIDWSRSLRDFLEEFVAIAMAHYDRVAQDAAQRRANLESFARDGYAGFSSKKGRGP